MEDAVECVAEGGRGAKRDDRRRPSLLLLRKLRVQRGGRPGRGINPRFQSCGSGALVPELMHPGRSHWW